MTRRWMRFCLLAVLLTTAVVSSAVETAMANAGGERNADGQIPEATEGILDLTGHSLAGDGTVLLNGEWEFYWTRLLEPDDLPVYESRAVGMKFERVPSIWSAYREDGKALKNRGYATYRLTVKLDKADAGRTLALYMPSVATAYKLWINEDLAAASGKVGRSKEEMTARNVPDVIRFVPKGRELQFVIQVSNFVQRKGGLWEALRLGNEEQISYLRTKSILEEACILGCLVIMGLYHIGLYRFRKKDPSPLYFGAICLAVGLRMTVLGQTLLPYLLPDMTWQTAVRIEYMTAIIAFHLLIRYIHSQYPRECSPAVRWISLIACAGFGLLVTVAPPSIFTQFMLPYQLTVALPTVLYVLVVYVLAAIRRRDGSLLNGIGSGFFGLTVGGDVLYYNHLIPSGNFIPYGLLGFMFTQSLNLAGRLSREFGRSEQLAHELVQVNEELEDKVRDRTAELRASHDRLERINMELTGLEQSRKQLLTAISHELGTPLTSIQGYVKLMIDGVLPADDRESLQLIYNKTKILDRIIQDLFELSKLEAGQLQFRFGDIRIVPFFRGLAEGYTVQFKKSGLRYELELGEVDVEAVIAADPVRLEQVIAIFVTNAEKFTLPGGTIRTSLKPGAMPVTQAPAIRLSVADTGPGIAVNDLPFVFDRFYRGSPSAGKREDGAGLGLAIAKQIVEQHGGVIGVESRHGEGSTFYMLLPLRHAEEGAV
ncbi:ATP-binding protein [Cohnella faecalis]|nr:ATP-binding protein [Cohnella faecalis]